MCSVQYVDYTSQLWIEPIPTGKIRQNVKFAVFVCVFLTKIKVDPESWCNKLPLNSSEKRKFLRTTSHDQDLEYNFLILGPFKNQEALITFLRGQDARQGSSECPPALN